MAPHPTDPPLPSDPGARRPLDAELLLGEATWLRRLARALVGDDASADDLVQDAFGAAIASRRPIRDLRGFLAGVVRRRSLEVRRTEARRRRREAERGAEGPTGAATLPGADEAVERADTMRVVLEELGHLPASQRDALVLRYVEGLEPAEIARRAGLAPPTVRAHLARGLASLRERLDRRAGGRGAWSAALAPWVGSGPPVGPDAPSSVPPSVPLGAASAAVAATSTAVMGWKIATAATVVPLVAIGLWVGSDGDDSTVERRVAEVTDVEENPATLARIHEDEVARVAVEAPAVAPDPVAEARPAAVEAKDSEVRVVDAETGEPVPWMCLELRTIHGPHAGITSTDAPGFASPGRAPGVFEVETDASGAFVLPGTVSGDAVIVVEYDDHPRPFGPLRSRVVDLPMTEPLEVLVGPTFQLEARPAPGVDWSELTARFATGPDDGRREMRTSVREGLVPWLRFHHAVTEIDGDGPWDLEVGDEEGLWWAEAEVHRKVGVAPRPVVLAFRELGAIEFVARHEPGRPIPIGAIELETETGVALRSVFLNAAQQRPGSTPPESSSKARARHLEPGRYRWRRGARSGEVDVTAGEVARVEFDFADEGTTFNLEIAIDATAVLEDAPPGEAYDLSDMPFRIARVGEPLTGFLHTPVPDPGRGPGHWRLELVGLPGGEWNVSPPGGLSPVRWEPQHATIGDGAAPPIFVARLVRIDAVVVLKIVDADTGEPLPSAEAAVSPGNPSWMILRADEEGSMGGRGLPADAEVSVLARAPGYRMAQLHFVPERDGLRQEMALQRGWGSLVRVLDGASYGPVEDVEVLVDDVSVGWTDERGVVEIEGDGPPDSIALGAGSDGLEITLSSIDRRGDGPKDPIVGFTVVVRRL
ncbi:MAG: RNA polymerase sigma factor [Planctomycetota bacterium]